MITHIILHENGDHRTLVGSGAPSESQVNGVEKQAVTQGRGVYIAKITSKPVAGDIVEQTHALNNPRVPFDEAVKLFRSKATASRPGSGNPAIA